MSLARKIAHETSRVQGVAAAAAEVAKNARHIRINIKKISDYADFILSKYPVVMKLSDDVHYISANPEEMAAYILALDSINFGSGYFYPGFDYADLAGGLKKTFERGELKNPRQWIDVTAKDLARILSVSNMDTLMELYAQSLRATGVKMLADYQGRALSLLEQANHSALQLAEIVAAWENFRDIHLYHGREIPIFKRAQILAADMHLALGGLNDMDALTIFADNMVPHVLRCDGILVYEEDLATKIDNGTPLLSGSAEEIEIRACAIHAVELMKQGTSATSVNLDHMLWHRGYESELRIKAAHRTLTVDY